MSHEYEKHFKKAKSKSRSTHEVSDQQLRRKLNVRKSSEKSKVPSPPILPVVFFSMCLVVAVYGYNNLNTVEQYIDLVEFEIFGGAHAAAGADADKKSEVESAQPSDSNTAKSTETKSGASKTECVEMKGFTEEELSHFNKLNERKGELDRRDAELTALEEELHKQRLEVESRIAHLEKIREEVGAVLEERVEVDQQKVSTLVEFYSNMKPKQAAEIFTNLNEDLAVEILGKMKKKNAADILNLLEPAKARSLSEKYTGYKRR
jgi:flagellar motility protein MotE (MotC chaperone)